MSFYLGRGEAYSFLLPSPYKSVVLGMPYAKFSGMFSDRDYREERIRNGVQVVDFFKKANDSKYFDWWEFYFANERGLYKIEARNTKLAEQDEHELAQLMDEMVTKCQNGGVEEDWGNTMTYTSGAHGRSFTRLVKNNKYELDLRCVLSRSGNCLQLELALFDQN